MFVSLFVSLFVRKLGTTCMGFMSAYEVDLHFFRNSANGHVKAPQPENVHLAATLEFGQLPLSN